METTNFHTYLFSSVLKSVIFNSSAQSTIKEYDILGIVTRNNKANIIDKSVSILHINVTGFPFETAHTIHNLIQFEKTKCIQTACKEYMFYIY